MALKLIGKELGVGNVTPTGVIEVKRVVKATNYDYIFEGNFAQLNERFAVKI
jgi:hypothetical protein